MSGFAEALAKIVSGCYVLTVPGDDVSPRAAVLVSFVQQVGFEPPRLVMAIRKGRSIVDRLAPGARCVLNICAAGDSTLLSRFAARPQEGEDPFRDLDQRQSSDGTILEAAAGHLACSIVARFDSGDHWLFLAEARDGQASPGRHPYVHVRRNGLSY